MGLPGAALEYARTGRARERRAILRYWRRA
jgi:hypothetical protein